MFICVFILIHPVLAENSEVLLQAGKEEVCLLEKYLSLKLYVLNVLLQLHTLFPVLMSTDAQAVL